MIERVIDALRQKGVVEEAAEMEKQLERIYRTLQQEMLKIDIELDRMEQLREISSEVTKDG